MATCGNIHTKQLRKSEKVIGKYKFQKMLRLLSQSPSFCWLFLDICKLLNISHKTVIKSFTMRLQYLILITGEAPAVSLVRAGEGRHRDRAGGLQEPEECLRYHGEN